MEWKVESWYGWGHDVFYFSKYEMVKTLAENCRKLGGRATISRRTEDGNWEEDE